MSHPDLAKVLALMAALFSGGLCGFAAGLRFRWVPGLIVGPLWMALSVGFIVYDSVRWL